MSILDIVLIIILALAAYTGYKRGLWVSIVSILAFILAILLGFFLMQKGVDILSNYISGLPSILPYLSFILIFALVAFLVNILGKFIKRTLDFTLLGSVDNIAGAVVGILKWAMGISFVLWLTLHLGIDLPGQNESFMYKSIQPFAPFVIDLVSSYMPFFKSAFQEIKEMLGSEESTLV